LLKDTLTTNRRTWRGVCDLHKILHNWLCRTAHVRYNLGAYYSLIEDMFVCDYKGRFILGQRQTDDAQSFELLAMSSEVCTEEGHPSTTRSLHIMYTI
jgi:hypothetical protein